MASQEYTQDYTQFTQHGDSQSQLFLDEPTRHAPPSIALPPPPSAWGKLIPSNPLLSPIDLEVRPPVTQLEKPTFTFLNLHLHPGDTFNCYTIGRSKSCDITPPKSDEGKSASGDAGWVHTLLSNTHCRIFCMLSTLENTMEVFVEDSSANGTVINRTTRLRRGERRLLNTGDEIGLVNENSLGKVGRGERRGVMQCYEFTFINVWQQLTPSVAKCGPVLLVAKKTNAAATEKTNTVCSTTTSTTTTTSIMSPKAMPPPSAPPSQLFPPTTPNSPQRVGTGSAMVATNGGRSARQRPGGMPVGQMRTFDRRIEEWYDVRNCIGSGTCGEVRKCINRQSGKQFAVKILSLQRFTGNLSKGLSVDELRGEAEMLRALDHPYIVKLEDVFTSDTAIYLVMELLHGGDLFDRIVLRGRYSETLARRVTRRILNAVSYLHDRQIIHRDLKPENILLVSGDDDYSIKVTDFGLAKKANKEGLRTFCGTPQYFAPEVLRRRNTVAGIGSYDCAVDMWSIGVILYILLSGSPPFDVSESIDAASSAKITFQGERWNDVSEEAKEIVKRMLEASPNERITVKEACDHDWMLIEDGDTHTHPLHDPDTSNLPPPPKPTNKRSNSNSSNSNGSIPLPPTKRAMLPPPPPPPPPPKAITKITPVTLSKPKSKNTKLVVKKVKKRTPPAKKAPKTAKSPGSAAILATGNGVLSDDDIDEFSDDEFDNAGLTKISDVFKRKEGQGGSQSSQKEKENVQEVARSPAEKKKKLQPTLDMKSIAVELNGEEEDEEKGGETAVAAEENAEEKIKKSSGSGEDRKQKTLADLWFTKK